MARKRKYTLNEDYFERIDNINKSYIVGFIYADGSIYKSYLTITLNKRDIEILLYIQKELNYNGPIYHRKEYVSLTISSKKICEDLKKIGIIQNKTYESKTLPVITPHLLPAFLLGFFDGDGSIYQATYNNKTEFCVNFSNNLCVLTELRNLLLKNNISSGKIRKRRENDISCMLDIKGSINIEKIYNLFYSNPPDCFLSRKKTKFDTFTEFKNNMKKRKFGNDKILLIETLYNNGKCQMEIAKILNLKYPSVKGVIQRLRKKLV